MHLYSLHVVSRNKKGGGTENIKPGKVFVASRDEFDQLVKFGSARLATETEVKAFLYDGQNSGVDQDLALRQLTEQREAEEERQRQAAERLKAEKAAEAERLKQEKAAAAEAAKAEKAAAAESAKAEKAAAAERAAQEKAAAEAAKAGQSGDEEI